ncbi:metal dependent phosphohydrolase [Thermincola ferriacetica]|uniref:Metal dependent phosphohydrolase n=1 Tax=Thermincola ferriacetica TaxID=281456 RepID=A0A0L6W5Z0_9FIRM|nr:HD domain-containing phosphohydrolase [Thermincola ferriacetica]KNZ70920.1 metal dependent phosphohydrolase [Thermincola ferriacetica]
MKQLKVDQLEPDMILAESVYSASGKVLLAEGTKLTPDLIKRLMEMQVPRVCVNDENTIPIDPNEVLTNRVHTQALRILGTVIPADLCGSRLEDAQFRYELVAETIAKIMETKEVHELFLDLRTIDDDTLDHSITVCVLSLIVGAALKFTPDRLYMLGIGAMVHDIGKKAVPPEILAKREDLTPQETQMFQAHVKEGYRILREHGFDVPIAKVALYHHERWNGSGYVNRLAGDNIDLFSRIVQTADVYDDLIRGLTYKQKYLPHEAMEYLYGAGNFYFDVRVVKAFTSSISAYPLGSLVKLSTGEIGVVVNVQKTSAPRPIVKICYDKNNNRLDYPRQIDLSEEKTIFITKIL